jgi:RNA polymerase sigma-70 factor (ECF subfamily)
LTAIDQAFELVRARSPVGFAEWMRLVELPLRASLRGFARVVDAEAVVQEALLRMWVVARDVELQGENASLRYALRIARNLALREAARQERFERLGDDPEPASVRVDPAPDPALRRTIRECLKRLPAKPGQALVARLRSQGRHPDRDLAAQLGMRVNTFLQNVSRARDALRKCLESRGVDLREAAR